MSYIYLQERGGESSAECFSDIPAFAPSKSSLIAGKSCCSGSATESCPSSQSGTMCGLSTGSRGEGKLTSSVEDSPAQTLPHAEKAQESMGKNLLFGLKWQESLVRYNPNTHSLKTPQCLLFEDSTECCATLPKWGMIRDGALWEGNASERQIETEYGLWGSPTASVWKDLTFTKEQCLKSTYGAQQNRFSTQYLKSTGEFPNPLFAEWIMEFPIGWTDLEPLEWHKFQSWLQQHLNY